MFRRASAILLLLVLCCAGSVQASVMAEAIDLYKARRYAEAQTAFEKVIAAESNNAGAAYYLGDLALMRDAPQEAVKWLAKATSLDPKSSEYFRALGDAYGLSAQRADFFSKLGLALKSHEAYERAVALAPDNIEARYALFNYCRQAPAIAGGGMDQARIQALAAHWPSSSSAWPNTNSARRFQCSIQSDSGTLDRRSQITSSAGLWRCAARGSMTARPR
jgi:tetratricopeptide (TPR) repeat protein